MTEEDLAPRLGLDERSVLAAQARRINPNLALSINRSVADRVEAKRELERLGPIPTSDHAPSLGYPDDEARERCELFQTNQRGRTLSFLWCQQGSHVWSRPRRQGHPPDSCPDHQR